MIDPDEKPPYSVVKVDGQFRVVDWEENIVLACGDAGSAGQYAALMNEAFRRGYKAGFRKGKGR